MYVKHLQLHNFKVISDFEATFEGNVYLVTGENEFGKSTLLEALGIALTGKREEVLRIGSEKGFLKTTIGDDNEDFEVDLKFTEKNPSGTLKITSKKTGMQSDRISMLQQIFGYQDFDAVEFSQWSETAEGRRKQVEVIKSLLPVKVQKRIAEIDAEVSKIKDDERKTANLNLKNYTTLVANAEREVLPGDLKKYENPIELKQLLEDQQQKAQIIEKAKTVLTAKENREKQLSEIPGRIEAETKKYDDEINRLNELIRIENEKKEKSLADIEAERVDVEARLIKINDWLAQYEATKDDQSDAGTKLQEAEEHNKKHRIVSDYKEKLELKKQAEKTVNDLEAKLAKLQKERDGLIKESKLPIKGLNFSQDGLELNGVPFAPGKVSDSQIMEVAAKLIILKNPTVKVFRIARGESLGTKRLQTIIDLAKKEGYQGFIEQVVRDQNNMQVEEYTEK